MGAESQRGIERIINNLSKTRQRAKLEQENVKYPATAEPALIHPINSSLVKIKDNGMIDIFVGTDNGIRLDPETKTIRLMQNNLQTKSVYEWIEVEQNRIENVGKDLIHNVGQDEVHNVKGDWTVHSKGQIRFIGDKGIYMEAREGGVEIVTPNLDLNGVVPPDGLDSMRPTLGLMFEDQELWGTKPPFGYRSPGIIKPYEKKPRYRREEYDDIHTDAYEVKPYLPYLRDEKYARKDLDGEGGLGYRKSYEKSAFTIRANKSITIETLQPDSKINIKSPGDVNIISGGKTHMD